MNEVLNHSLCFCLGFIGVLWESESPRLGFQRNRIKETEFEKRTEQLTPKAPSESETEAAGVKGAGPPQPKPPVEFHDSKGD